MIISGRKGSMPSATEGIRPPKQMVNDAFKIFVSLKSPEKQRIEDDSHSAASSYDWSPKSKTIRCD